MTTRRSFLAGSSAAMGFPTIVPSTVFGQSAPSNHIQVAQLGCGRIARGSEFPGILRHHNSARFVAVCDVDTVRLTDAKELLEQRYTQLVGAGKFAPIKIYEDYREMLADKGIDAVCISTPDHWHSQPAMEAALAGKDIYLQKPAALTIAEGRHMADTLAGTDRILQLGSQQRSSLQFRLACELVRNGRIGKLREIYIGLPVDPGGRVEPEMPVPGNLNYERWIGSTPMVYYTEKRVHPQSPDIRARYDRPGWLRCEQFGAGMITGWGTHHIDIAHWAMDTELSGPISADAIALFPKSGLWDVHGPYQVKLQYDNGVAIHISDKFPNGLRFIGDDGWIWVTRGTYAAGEPAPGKRSKVLDASDPEMLRAGIKEGELRLHASPNNDHHLDWLTSIRSRKPPVTTAEIGHRSCSACLVAHAAMRLGREVKWNPKAERFGEDEAANAMIARPQRAPYGTTRARG